jgi:hypothetical protein
MDIFITIAALAASLYVAYAFVKAGVDKLRTSDAALLARGWGWVEKFPKGSTKFIGLAELLGGLGVILAPVAVTVFNFDWAKPIVEHKTQLKYRYSKDGKLQRDHR